MKGILKGVATAGVVLGAASTADAGVVYAAEEQQNTGEENFTEEQVSSEEQVSVNNETLVAVDDAVEAVGNVTDKSLASDIKAVNASLNNIQNAVEELDAADSAASAAVDSLYNDVKAAETALDNRDVAAAEQAIKAAESSAINADNAKKEASDKLESVKADAQAEADKAVEAINDAYNKASNKADAAKNEADKAADKASEADSKYETAKKNSEDALDNLNEATDAANKANKEAFEKSKEATNAGIEKAKADTEAYIAGIEKINADKAAKIADTNNTNAQNELIKVTEANKAALEIIKLQEEVQAGNANDWNKCDELFASIIKGYYVPEVLKLSDGAVAYPNGFTKFTDDSKNYYKLTIENEDGSKEDLYLNYKLDETGKRLVIFEKTETEVVVKEGVAEKYVSVDGSNVELSVDEFKTGLGNGDVIEVDNTYYYKNTDGIVTVDKALSDNQSVSAEEETKELVDGKWVVTNKGTVTTTTSEDLTLNGRADYDSEDDAKAAAQSTISATNNDDVEISNVDIKITTDTTTTTETTYDASADVSFVTKLTTVIDIAGVQVEHDDNWKKANNEVTDWKDSIVSKLEDAGFKVLSGTVSDVKNEKIVDNKGSIFDWFPNDTYEYKSGKITIEYVAVDSKTVNYSTWDNITDIFSKDKKQKAIIEETYKKDGTEILDFTGWNWNLTTADVKVVGRDTVTGTATGADTKATAESEAKSAAIEAANAKASSKATSSASKVSTIVKGVVKNASVSTTGTAVYSTKVSSLATENIKASDVETKEIKTENTITKYGYEASFTKTSQSVEEDVVLKVTEYSVVELEHQDEIPAETKIEYTNDKYDAGEYVLVEETDEGLNNFLNNAKKSVNNAKAKAEATETKKTEADNRAAAAAAKKDAADKKASELADKKKAADQAAREAAGKAAIANANATKAAQEKTSADIAYVAAKINKAVADRNASETAAASAKANSDLEAIKNAKEKVEAVAESIKNLGLSDNDTTDVPERISAAQSKVDAAKKPQGGNGSNNNGGNGSGNNGGNGSGNNGGNNQPTVPAVNPVGPGTVQILPGQVPLAPAPANHNANAANNNANVNKADAEENATKKTPAKKNGLGDLVNKGNKKQDAGVVNIADEEVPLGVLEDENVVELEDNMTPLAPSVDAKKSVWWWWILIVAAVTGTAGKTAYDKKHKKGLFKEKNKDNK